MTWEPGLLPDHISASQLAMFERCPEQYRQRYVWGRKEAPGGALILGKAFHSAQETGFRMRMQHGTRLSTGAIQDAFSTEFDRGVIAAQDSGEGEIQWGRMSPGETKDIGVKATTTYYDYVAQAIRPIAVEDEFSVAFPGVDVPVVGFIDIVEEARVIDMKTATSKPKNGEPKPDWAIQEMVYQAVLQRPLEWHVITKTKTPAVYTAETDPDYFIPWDDTVGMVAKAKIARGWWGIKSHYDRWGPDAPWDGHITHNWACGYCGYYDNCRWKSGKKKPR